MSSVNWLPFCPEGDEGEWGIYAPVNYAVIGSDNGLSPFRRLAITWNGDRLLLIGPLGTYLSKICIGIKDFHSRKEIWKCRLINVDH